MELELGTLLKKAREEKGLSLDDIQEETKIRKKYLEAIEENNFDILPGKVYLKVFVKGYAREVDLNYQALLDNYEVLNIQEEKESNLQKDYLNGTKVSSGSKNEDKKNPFKIIFIMLLILFLGAAVVYTYQYINNSEIRLLNQQNLQNENIEEDSQLLEVEENKSAEITSENEEEINRSVESSIDNFNEADNELNSISYEADNNNLLDSFDSSVFTEENTEIIDQNNFNGLEGLNDQEQNQISEIIISEELSNQQEEIEEQETAADEDQDVAQSETAQVNNNIQNEDQSAEEVLDSDNPDQGLVNASENQDEAVLDNNIQIAANDTVWVTIDVDGANAFSGILEAGDQQQFEIEDSLYIKIGNGSAITAEINGEVYGPWAENAAIAEVEFLNEGEEITINNLRN
jgi:cytoskeletal protein RodZ